MVSFFLLPFYLSKFLVSKHTREFWIILATKHTLFSQCFWNIKYTCPLLRFITGAAGFFFGEPVIRRGSLLWEINTELVLHRPHHLFFPRPFFRRGVGLKLKMRMEWRTNNKGYSKMYILE